MENNAAIAMSEEFLTAYSNLPKTIQGKVRDFIDKFRKDPRSLGTHLEKLSAMDKNIRSARIDRAYRAIVAYQQESNVYLLLWVDHHDEAYAWASRKTFMLNDRTGTIQVFEIQNEKVPEKSDPSPISTLFGELSDEDMMKLGAPEIIIPYLKNIQTKEEFFESKDKLPKDVYENFSWIAEGFAVNETIEMVQENHSYVSNNSGAEGFLAALKNNENKNSFLIIDSEEELRNVMSAPLEKWRVFLHPAQRKIVENHYNGPVKILGGAGTGKTVVALHRAKFLASQLNSDKKIFFTTYNNNLKEDIEGNLGKICTPEEMAKIEVLNLDAWVVRFLSENNFYARVEYNDGILDELWKKAVADSKIKNRYSLSFFKTEWKRVAVSQEALTLEKYLSAKRRGRGTPLSQAERTEVWKVFDSYLRLTKEKKICDKNLAMYECTRLIENGAAKNMYAHIIVDEGQDFSDNAFKLLRALAGDEKPDDIFIVGDAHQRIYSNYPTLSSCGINVKGRSHTLNINYRTTEETRNYAFSLLNDISFDDLDDDVDAGDKCRSLVRGEKPVVKSFSNEKEESRYLIDKISELTKNGVPLKNICVVARTNQIVKNYSNLLQKNGYKTYQLKPSQSDDLTHDGVRLATMHRVKGLEFQYIFVVSVNKDIIPLDFAIDYSDPVSEKESITSEKSLLYVALTRAQKQAYITSYGKRSEFI